MSKKIDQFHEVDMKDSKDSVEADSYYSNLGFFHGQENNASNPGDLILSDLAHISGLDDLYLDIVSPPFQACGDDIRLLSSIISQDPKLVEVPNHEEDRKNPYPFPSESMEILKHCRSRVGRVSGRKIHGPRCDSASSSSLSTNHIIELAASNFIQSNSRTSHPYATSLLGLSSEDAKDIQLVQDILSCAEKVADQKYDRAGKLLEECKNTSFGKTTTIQRLVYYFSEGLQEKIERETGRFTGKSRANKWSSDSIIPSSATAALHQKLPLTQVNVFAGIQSMVDQVSDHSKVHIIDLQVRCGVHHTILMQALASRSERPLVHLKITAVAMNSKRLVIEESGIRLRNEARSLNLNFSFNVISLEDILALEENPFDLDDEEAVIVHASYVLEHMITNPNRLESLMRVIKNTNPLVMIISEAESNGNSPIFVNRFVESLFFYGAYFDCMEECMKNDTEDRTVIESMIFGPAIGNILAAEGEERKLRTVGIDIWRAFFARFGMVEIELSKMALFHANLVRKNFECGDSCTIGLNGSCLIIGWKGTPVSSLSAWKFEGM